MAAPTTGNDKRGCNSAPYGNCTTHGGRMLFPQGCQTIKVLDDVRAERARQFAKYGDNSYLEDGTGPDTMWLAPFTGHSAGFIEDTLRVDYELYKRATNGPPTWMHLVREEAAEAFKEQDPTNLRAELIQVAALCVSWVEKIDARREAK